MPEVKPAEIQSTAVIKVVGVGGAGGELWGAFGVAVAVFVPGGGDFDESFDVFPGVLAV